MEQLKNFRDNIFKKSPGYVPEIDQERTKTSKMLYARKRVSFTRMFAPGIHFEAEDYIMDKRLKGGMFRHFRYFGPRGEIIWYGLATMALICVCKMNIKREENIEGVLNDNNVYLKLELPMESRKIN